MTRPTAQGDHGTDDVLAVLKSLPYEPQWRVDATLPYRIDLLAEHGYRLVWTDRQSSSALARLEAITVPFVQAWRTRRNRAGGRAVLAMFESEGHGLALTRRFTGNHRPRLVIIACWLADLAVRSRWRRFVYRRLYRAVDGVVVFSANQVDTLTSVLALDPTRVHPVRFGVDLEALDAVTTSEVGGVVAVGRDRGRDWRTLVEAASGAPWTVDVVTRPQQVAGLELPCNVRSSAPLDRDAYLRLTANAAVVVVPTEVREYPSGQSVLLEALALGKACVVTDTPALREYVVDGETALMVPPHDPRSLRAAIDRLLADGTLRARLGMAAAAREHQHGGARAMWRQVSVVLDGLPE